MTSPTNVEQSALSYQQKIEEARRFLAQRGITDVRPVYGRNAPKPVPAHVGKATRKAHLRWFAPADSTG